MKNAVIIPYQTRAPIMISKEHRLADLIVHYCHLRVKHNMVKQSITEIRASYWICKIKCFVKKLLRTCVVCKKLNRRKVQCPSHSDLPASRFNIENAFSSVDVDYRGPYRVQS